MTDPSFNFGYKKTETTDQSIDKPKNILNFLLPDKKKDVDTTTVALLDIIIDIFRTMPEDTPTYSAKNTISRRIQDELKKILIQQQAHLSANDQRLVHKNVMDELFGLGPITDLLNNPDVTEVMVNGPDNIYIEIKGKLQHIPIAFRNDQHMHHVIDKIVSPIGRRIDESSPMVDARLPDGSRVNIIIPPLALNGPTITIRKFAEDPFTLDDLITFNTLNSDMYAFFEAAVKGKTNIIVSGGTGSGKTTFLNVLSSFIPDTERIITIEDAAELQLQQNHVITLESRPPNIEGKGEITIRNLVINSLRMRPDRIIVGEVRSSETLDMLQAMNTGHEGSITTIHANSPRDSLSRMETMVHMSGVELPTIAIREQIASAIHIIVHISRYIDGSRKVSKISEITGMTGNVITMQDIFEFKHIKTSEQGNIMGKHIATGIIPKCVEKLKEQGQYLPVSIFAEDSTAL